MESISKEQQLEAAHTLIKALESGKSEQAQQALTTLTQIQESDLFQQVGKLTRELHDSLSNFNIDPRLIDLTENDIPSTRERLDYVIATTEDAAHQTLDLIEQTLPLTSALQQSTDKINKSWHQFSIEEIDANKVNQDLEAYLPNVKQHSEQIHANLTEMTVIQGFQDVTGQVVRQVIILIEEVEDNLVKLVKLSGQKIEQKNIKPVDPIKAEGPQINQQDNPDVVNNQDEVDDLLLSLGF
ncbi:MAG: protein phosphatase CheZ [Piscirickettsiaceae bacterium]|nr:protein phosphatase CheZ [Piscirickettsiaceae bacterium]